MKNSIYSSIANFASLATIGTMVVGGSFDLKNTFDVSVMLALIVLSIVALFFEVSETIRTRPFKANKNDKQKINKFMGDLIKNGGVVKIVSRDLSWATDTQIQKMLLSKSSSGEITLYLHGPVSQKWRTHLWI